MSVATPETGFPGMGLGDGEGEGISPATVAGGTTFFILVVSAICMWMGADAQRVLLSASLSMILFALISYSPAAGIPVAIGYLSCVGALKRYAIPILGYSSFDPLLLVAPTVAMLFFLNRVVRRDIPRDTPLSKLVLAMIVVMALEVVNPLQGGLLVGFGGAMFYIIPMLWYYIGRSFGTAAVRESLLKATVFIGVLGALYAFYQQFFGFTEIELQWLALTKNDAGQRITDKVMRVFSFFSSFAEYTHFLNFGVVISLCFMLRRNRLFVLPLLFLLTALLFSSSRGGLLAGVFGCCVVWGVQGKTPRIWVPRLVVAGVVGVAALFYGLTSVKSANLEGTSQTLLDHQARGILAPLDKKSSTGESHVNLIVGGFTHAIRNPVGSGLGITTLAAGKLGSAGASTEFDISDMYVTCGLIGGPIYSCIVGLVVWRSARRWHLKRDLVSLCSFAILASTIGAWLISGHYPATALTWFLIGGLDREELQELLPRLRAAAAERRNRAVNRWPGVAAAGNVASGTSSGRNGG